MAASTNTTTNFTNSNDANFRAWGLAIHNAIIAGGWVNTADTGQIDFSTVTAPAVVSTAQGYKIYRSNDAGGSLVEFYVKLEFGSGATSALRPSLWITAGFQGTDGAGNLLTTVNPTSTRSQGSTNANPSGGSISVNMAAGSGYMIICGTSATASEDVTVSIERTRTGSSFNNEIFVQVITGNSLAAASGFSQVVNRNQAFIATGYTTAGVIPPNANTPVAGIVALGQVFGMSPGPTAPSINIFGVEAGALGVYQDTVPINIGSPPVAHNYKIQRDMTFMAQATTVLLTRFE